MGILVRKIGEGKCEVSMIMEAKFGFAVECQLKYFLHSQVQGIASI